MSEDWIKKLMKRRVCLLDVKLLESHGILNLFELLLHLATLQDKLLDDFGENSSLHVRSWRFHLCPLSSRVESSWDCGETDIVLLDQRWIQGIEVEQENECVVESTLGLQDKTTTVLLQFCII